MQIRKARQKRKSGIEGRRGQQRKLDGLVYKAGPYLSAERCSRHLRGLVYKARPYLSAEVEGLVYKAGPYLSAERYSPRQRPQRDISEALFTRPGLIFPPKDTRLGSGRSEGYQNQDSHAGDTNSYQE